MIYPTLTPLFFTSNKIDLTKTADTVKRKEMLDLCESFITDALAVATEICQQPLIASTREMYFDLCGYDFKYNNGVATGYERIIPFTFLVASAVLKNRLFIADDWVSVDTSTYRVVLRDKNYYLEYWNMIASYPHRLTFTVGYTESTLPPAIQKIILDMATWSYKQSPTGFDLIGKSNVAESGGVGSSTTTLRAMEDVFFERLRPYRIETVA